MSLNGGHESEGPAMVYITFPPCFSLIREGALQVTWEVRVAYFAMCYCNTSSRLFAATLQRCAACNLRLTLPSLQCTPGNLTHHAVLSTTSAKTKWLVTRGPVPPSLGRVCNRFFPPKHFLATNKPQFRFVFDPIPLPFKSTCSNPSALPGQYNSGRRHRHG